MINPKDYLWDSAGNEPTIPIPLGYAHHLFLVLGGIANSSGDESVRDEAETLLAFLNYHEGRDENGFLPDTEFGEL